MKRFWISGLVTLILVLIAQSVPAQTKVMPTEELTRQAEVVAVGKVSSLVSHWNEDHSRIVTSVTLTVDEYVKGGTPGQPLTIVVPGGEVDGVGEIYSHMATFQQGENVLVFAEKDEHGSYRVSSGHQGKFTIRKDDVTGKPTVGGTMTLEGMTDIVKKAVIDPNKY